MPKQGTMDATETLGGHTETIEGLSDHGPIATPTRIVTVDAAESQLQRLSAGARGPLPTNRLGFAPSGLPWSRVETPVQLKVTVEQENGFTTRVIEKQPDIAESDERFDFAWISLDDHAKGTFASMFRLVDNHPENPARRDIPDNYFGADGRVRNGTLYLMFAAQKTIDRERGASDALAVGRYKRALLPGARVASDAADTAGPMLNFGLDASKDY